MEAAADRIAAVLPLVLMAHLEVVEAVTVEEVAIVEAQAEVVEAATAVVLQEVGEVATVAVLQEVAEVVIVEALQDRVVLIAEEAQVEEEDDLLNLFKKRFHNFINI